MDIGGSTSDILVLGKENQQISFIETPKTTSCIMESAPVAATCVETDYDKLGRKELCELVRQRGLEEKVDLDELSRREIVDFLKSNESTAVDYDELGRKELCELVQQRGLEGKVDLDELSKQL